ncbi:hypothetical protein ACFLZ7_00190 [Nanoarchaeota archaeon]
MEKFFEARHKAKKYLRTADHILTMTYPLVNDPKLLLAVMDNIFLALTNSLSAILYFERYQRLIPPFHDNFESKFNIFKLKVADKYKLDREYLQCIQEVKEIIANHKKSPVEFSRKDVFVICSDKYQMQTVSINQVKSYISRTKNFIQEVEGITCKYE